MPDLKDRRVAILLVATLLVLAAAVTAVILICSKTNESIPVGVGSVGGLVVQTGRDDDVKLDPKGPIGCFVAGRRVADVPLSECARRNGVSPGALDVGLDQNGVLAAAGGSGGRLTPLPSATADQLQAEVAAGASPSDTCWRRSGDVWTRISGSMGLNACVQALFAGRCLPDGAEPVLGRWGAKTLRLEPGEVDLSDNDHDFRPIAGQAADCSIPTVSSAGQGL